MSTFDQKEEYFTEKQDEITDILLKIHKTRGEAEVRQFLRLAVINYVEEAPVPGRHKRLQRIQLLNSLAEAITIPCHQHNTL